MFFKHWNYGIIFFHTSASVYILFVLNIPRMKVTSF